MRKEAKRPRTSAHTKGTTAPAGNKGSAGAFHRQQFKSAIQSVVRLLCLDLPWDAMFAAEELGLPDVALRRIARAEAELRRAKKALQLWRDGR